MAVDDVVVSSGPFLSVHFKRPLGFWDAWKIALIAHLCPVVVPAFKTSADLAFHELSFLNNGCVLMWLGDPAFQIPAGPDPNVADELLKLYRR